MKSKTWKVVVRSWKSEVRSRKSEYRKQNTRNPSWLACPCYHYSLLSPTPLNPLLRYSTTSTLPSIKKASHPKRDERLLLTRYHPDWPMTSTRIDPLRRNNGRHPEMPSCEKTPVGAVSRRRSSPSAPSSKVRFSERPRCLTPTGNSLKRPHSAY